MDLELSRDYLELRTGPNIVAVFVVTIVSVAVRRIKKPVLPVEGPVEFKIGF